MPAPAFPFNPLSDSELSIKKPITQSMMRRLRDDSWIKLPDAGVTEELDTSKSLKPDGAGGTMWGIGGMTASQDASSNTGADSSADVTLPGGTVSLINFTGVVGNGASTDSLVQGSIVVFPDGTFRGQWVDCGDLTPTAAACGSFNSGTNRTVGLGGIQIANNNTTHKWTITATHNSGNVTRVTITAING